MDYLRDSALIVSPRERGVRLSRRQFWRQLCLYDREPDEEGWRVDHPNAAFRYRGPEHDQVPFHLHQGQLIHLPSSTHWRSRSEERRVGKERRQQEWA